MPKKLTRQIQSLKKLILELDQLENNDSTETVLQLLKIMANMFAEVDHRLAELEKKKLKKSQLPQPKTNH